MLSSQHLDEVYQSQISVSRNYPYVPAADSLARWQRATRRRTQRYQAPNIPVHGMRLYSPADLHEVISRGTKMVNGPVHPSADEQDLGGTRSGAGQSLQGGKDTLLDGLPIAAFKTRQGVTRLGGRVAKRLQRL